ncbi:hypothetical protein DRH27_00495 [Candidatus Falkowbacteria bacterium]|nr:MAG: hypothetical protein DRH27_00495 [Candidatus Falkowbacteria bacterium]
MAIQQITIWDGIRFSKIPESEAVELEAAGKCQIIRGCMSGPEFKTRDQMGGYKTREMTPEKKTPKKRAKKKAAAK